jgi:hypothetical protein
MGCQRKISEKLEVIFMFPFEYWIGLAVVGMAACLGVMFWGFKERNGSYN